MLNMSEVHCTKESRGNYTKGKEVSERKRGFCWNCLVFVGYYWDEDINKKMKKIHKKHQGMDWH